jgi:hypothetical protein
MEEKISYQNYVVDACESRSVTCLVPRVGATGDEMARRRWGAGAGESSRVGECTHDDKCCVVQGVHVVR